MGRVLVGGLVGGMIVFAWGAVAHMALPLGTTGISRLPDEAGVVAAVKATVREPGLYFFPGMDMSKPMSATEREAWEAKLKAGPTGLMIVNPTGGEPMSPKQLATEFASNVVAALLASYLLTQVAGGYLARVRFLALLGVFGWLSINVSYWNWYGFPTDFTGAAAVDETVGWLLAGLALAKIVRPAALKAEPVAV